MKTFKFLLCFFALAALVLACQKELSHESGNTTPSDGSLLGAGGNCQSSTVGGVYQKDTSLNSSNYVDVTVTVNTGGSYLVYSDTVNGMWFRATGNFTATGAQSVRLTGYGKPIAAGTNTFNVYYDSTQCTFSITTITGVGAAVYTLSGGGSTCINASFQGTYTQGVATTASNTMTVEVNVSTIGTYSMTATADGVTFSKSGVFAATGVQSVILTATGTPTSAGTFPVPVVAGTSTCSKDLTVGSASSGAVYTLVGNGAACSGAFALAGTYTQGVALTASNTVTVQVNVTTAGSYSLTTNAQNGITFSASGTFAATGLQTVVMTATGQTPTNAGAFTYTVSGASTTCTFSITYAAATPPDYYPTTAGSNWSYNTTDYSTVPATTDTLLRKVGGTSSINSNTYTYFLETNDISQGFDSSGYFRKNTAKDYFQWLDVGYFFGLDNSVWGEYIMLKDYVAAGNEWTSSNFAGTYSSLPILVRYKDSIQQKNVTVTVLSTSYPNTIVVKEKYEYSFDNGTTWTIAEYTLNYYSLGYGLIKQEWYSPAGALDYKQEMNRSQVN